jgi:hypothetical protein
MTENAVDRPSMKIVDLIKYGFFFGLGLTVAAWAAYGAVYLAWPKQSCSSGTSATDSTDRSASKQAAIAPEVAEVEEHKAGAQLYFTGVVKNSGTKQISSPHVEVNLFKGGKFVDQYSSYMSGPLEAGESRYFKVACDCKDLPHADYDSYKVRVVSGF